MSMELRRGIHRLARASGIDFAGCANIEPAREFSVAHGFDPGEMGHAVTLGIRIPAQLYDGIVAGHRGTILAYRHHCQSASALLDVAAAAVARALNSAGHLALPVPSGQTVYRDRFLGLASHRVAASLSGLGFIGASCLFIHSEFGPRVRLATVFTSAHLPARETAQGDCSDCGACAEACPASALTGRPFDPSEPREARLDPKSCYEYSVARSEEWGVDRMGSLCGVCVAVCPHGRK